MKNRIPAMSVKSTKQTLKNRTPAMCVKSTKKTQQNRRCTYLSPPNQQTHKIQYLRKVANTKTESATCFVSGLQDGQDDFFYTIWKIFNDAKCDKWKNELLRFKRKTSFSSWLYPFYIHSSSYYWMKIKKSLSGACVRQRNNRNSYRHSGHTAAPHCRHQ